MWCCSWRCCRRWALGVKSYFRSKRRGQRLGALGGQDLEDQVVPQRKPVGGDLAQLGREGGVHAVVLHPSGAAVVEGEPGLGHTSGLDAVWSETDPLTDPPVFYSGDGDEVLWGGFMAPPWIPSGIDKDPNRQQPTLNDLNSHLHRFFELGTVFTMIAGLLNILVIYDAWGGPVFSEAAKKEDEEENDEAQMTNDEGK